MHLRNLLSCNWPIMALLISSPLWAQTSATSPAPEAPQTLEQAAAQRERANEMRNETETRYAAEQAACYQNFLVNDCLAEAKKRYTQSLIDARNIDIPARNFQREAKRADVAAKEAKREEDRPQREAEQKEQAENYRAEQTAKALEREKKLADKARQAAEGRKKTAAEQAKRQEKQAERAKKDAERAARKAQEK